MSSYFTRIIWLGFITTISIVAWLGITSYRNNKISGKNASWLSHANNVLYHSEEILSLTIDLESGQRGFGMTGIEEFLEPTTQAAQQLLAHTQSLKEILHYNPDQQRRLNQLEDFVRKKIDFTILAIDARRAGGLDSAIAMNSSMRGKHLTDSIRVAIEQIQTEESRHVDKRTEIVRSRMARTANYFVGLLFTTGVILVLLFYFIYINLKARTKAEQSLRQASDTIQDIYNNAPCGYHSIDSEARFIEINNTWLDWLKCRRDDVLNKLTFQDILTPESTLRFNQKFGEFKKSGAMHDEEFTVQRMDGTTFPILVNSKAIYLEDGRYAKSRSTVIDFTEQKKALERIEQLNQELESFSYSVSHDLRAPLRSIDGYTQILIEDYAPKLDDEGKRVLQVVVNNARRMAKLIDDLLDFSRVGRKEITKTAINTSSLVKGIVSELTAQETHRDISLTIDELHVSSGDPNLLRQVWLNLISNALKYTRKKEKTMIKISSESTPDEIIFSVKDNGTGFDMQYAGKLFGVFQRLHRQNDFEGTGVGLAIVHRIISRHGGRVWAAAEVGSGATFFFSLPTNESYPLYAK